MRGPVFCLCLVSMLLNGPVVAQPAAPGWVAQKCAAYRAAWDQALDMFGSDGMNYAFIAGSENFIAAGCTDPTRICPQSAAELEVANALTLAMMNAGAASTFLPFACPHAEPEEGGWTGPGL